MIDRLDITGLVLAGGRGRRMGGVDKGIERHAGQPLAQHALKRLAPQVGTVAVNANRNADVYAAFGVPVWPDSLPDRPGPLAGFLTGCERCATPYLATVPCDAPLFPIDLVERLGRALTAQGADLAIAVTREHDGARAQTVFCLMRVALAGELRRYLMSGERRADVWARSQRCAEVVFEDAGAFLNLNTADDLRRLQDTC